MELSPHLQQVRLSNVTRWRFMKEGKIQIIAPAIVEKKKRGPKGERKNGIWKRFREFAKERGVFTPEDVRIGLNISKWNAHYACHTLTDCGELECIETGKGGPKGKPGTYRYKREPIEDPKPDASRN